jgi:hypothetical protein
VPFEKRTRVEIFLPLGFNSVVHRTVTEWLAEELTFARGGSTITTPFTGFYATAAQAEIVRDDVQILFCDFDLDADNSDELAELDSYLNDIRSMLLRVFRQEEIWIIYHPVARVL